MKMLDLVVDVVYLLVLLAVVVCLCRRLHFCVKLRALPGPPALPILGNSLILTGTQEEFFRLMSRCANKYGNLFRLWIGLRPFIFLYRAEAIQPILNSSVHIDKSYEYNFLLPWLGTGLLTSTGNKWHLRRKLLTPSFHSKVLEDFLEPMYQQSLFLCSRLKQELDKPCFNVTPYAKLCALDIICDTAMGANMHAQQNSHSEYVSAIDSLTEILQRRFITPWLKPDFIFQRSKLGKKQEQYLKIIHDFTRKVISERKQEKQRQNSSDKQIPQQNGIKEKQRLALLDLLLEVSEDGKVLSDRDICEEVDTFMFAGHDTISAGVSWVLYVLGHHLDSQEKIVEELKNVMEEDEKWPSLKQLQKLGYLERCIKEALRLYPVAPLIARDIKHPIKILDYSLPPGVTILINTYLLHRDPQFFPNPDVFDPDRFLLSNCEVRHPFAYIPFSAGPRNCIGQRFAMLELKIILSTVLQTFIIKSVDREEQLNLIGELVLINRDGIRLAISTRT